MLEDISGITAAEIDLLRSLKGEGNNGQRERERVINDKFERL
jgi:hypothetical protein